MQGTIITNRGLKLIAKLAASGAALTFTRAVVGTGQVPTGYDAAGMNGLNEYVMDGNIASYGVCEDAEDTAYVVFQVSSIGLKTGFTVTEAGLFATDPDEGEILYAYFDMRDDPQYIYAEGQAVSKFIEMTLNVVIGRTQSVTALINPGSLITRTGDIAETKIDALDIPDTEFPVPKAGETTRTFLGKVVKAIMDFNLFAKLFRARQLTLAQVNDASVTSLHIGQITPQIAQAIGIAGAEDVFLVLHLPIIGGKFPSQLLVASSGKQRMYYRTCANGIWQIPHEIFTTDRLVNNGVTTEPGFALDARFGKILSDNMLQTNNSLRELMIGRYIAISNWFPDGFEVSLIARAEPDGVAVSGTVKTRLNLAPGDYNLFGLTSYTDVGMFNPHNIIHASSITNAMLYPHIADTRYFRIRLFQPAGIGTELYVAGKALFK